MDFNDTPEEAEFRAEARAWLDSKAERLPDDERALTVQDVRSDPDAMPKAQAWQAVKADGGWAWTIGEESDALGTGIAMYALLRSGLAADSNVLRTAQRYLVSTQEENGSWAVKGTKKNKKAKVQETASYWGTTWAVLALSEGLPKRPAKTKP